MNFHGTDSLSAIIAASRWYDAESMPAFSIPAAEHSTITGWGRENERATYEICLIALPTSILLFLWYPTVMIYGGR
ncbi:putative nicotinate phosphoribosyltransferase [Aggregatibacter aphrophilus]|uniref:Putative nicotinate phosphoribosyltransferase n=1 Tax=Aggregatibacter aphrophilus TaxID=732 RepID=A0A336N7U2_AGGAP|nr:putative nicotinate phosphoribosyltransferase [Aggregatibacter aphrophilus]